MTQMPPAEGGHHRSRPPTKSQRLARLNARFNRLVQSFSGLRRPAGPATTVFAAEELAEMLAEHLEQTEGETGRDH